MVPLTRASLTVAIPHLSNAVLTLEAVLCPLTGFAAWLVWRRIDVGLDRKRAALRRWGWFLLVSDLWPSLRPAFPNPAFPALALLLCLVLAGWTAFSFRSLQPRATLLMLPYIAWIATIVIIATVSF